MSDDELVDRKPKMSEDTFYKMLTEIWSWISDESCDMGGSYTEDNIRYYDYHKFVRTEKRPDSPFPKAIYEPTNTPQDSIGNILRKYIVVIRRELSKNNEEPNNE